MDSGAMAFGAFMLAAGVLYLITFPTLNALGFGGFHVETLYIWGAIIVAAIGAAILAWGVGE